MAQQKFRVGNKAPNGLFLRSEPLKKTDGPTKKEATKKALLPLGHLVTKKGDAPVADWWEVSTTVDGVAVDGFVNSTYLVADSAFTPAAAISSVSAVHLPTNASVTRVNKSRLAFALNEAGQPTRAASASPSNKAKQLTEIVKWLDVEHKARYAPNSSHTYCNIYAYDYCHLGGVFLPRVWWNSSALEKLRAGTPVSPVYGASVYEINANGLFNWLKEWGPTFGWTRSFDFTQVQNAANDGQVVVICGPNKVPNKSGHITAVVPETSTQKADRNGATVTQPLQSQAGRSNKKYFVRPWWNNGSFLQWGYWINAS